MTLIKEKKIIDPRDFGLPGSPQSEECRFWACWLWMGERKRLKKIERHKENMAMVMISILSSPVNTTHAFPDWSFWGWILSTKFYISFPLRYKQ